jgi:hypothetical protein
VHQDAGDLDEDRVWDEQVASELCHQRRGERVSMVAAVGGCD